MFETAHTSHVLALSGVLLSAFISGLIASPHCVSMCGGIALGFSQTPLSRWRSIVVPHITRIGSYSLMGLVSYALIGQHLEINPKLLSLSRLLPALGLVVAALLALRQSTGSCASRCHQKNCGNRGTRAQRWHWLTWCWGLLPCPMVLAMVTASLGTHSAWQAAAFMAAFGIGTLPSLLGLSLLSRQIGQHLNRQQRFVWPHKTATLLLVAGLWTGGSTILLNEHHHGAHTGTHAFHSPARAMIKNHEP